ncbi:MAG: MFS transporter [Deltaproteobacteria bacterium]|jgi:POT family proton-dependent oligopeptide transporter|nr:MFS transporter [Deltaproteobacteria bacterium]
MSEAPKEVKNPLQEIVKPFVDLVHAPRALWGINLSYLFEGMVYFGMLGYLTMYYTQYLGLGDTWSSYMVGFLTYGITFSMFLFGGVSDRFGVRKAILLALCLMLVGRVVLAYIPYSGISTGLWSSAFFISIGGLFLIILGYGMYQPAAYSAVKQFTTPATATMGYAMLYALMNLGGWLPSFFSPIRRSVEISGTYWVFSGITLVALIGTSIILTSKVVKRATERAKEKAELEKKEKKSETGEENTINEEIEEVEKLEVEAVAKEGKSFNLLTWFKEHPLADPKFSFLIFSLIPVQTLFAYNWLVMPKFVSRAFQGSWVGENFEAAVNLNPLLIFILVPIITAITMKRKIYNMMIVGTLVMALPTFLFVAGNNIFTLGGYILIMTIGEAMWQPRFLQLAAEIAPEGKTGAYMGVAQFPWFLTKVIASLYAGLFLAKYCPKDGTIATEQMWLIFGIVAMITPVLLIVAKPWLATSFKTQGEE